MMLSTVRAPSPSPSPKISSHKLLPTPALSPTPSPSLTAAPAATVTVTVTPPPPSPVQDGGDTLNDYLQGWGAILAVLVALGVALWTQRRADKSATVDRQRADKQRAEDRVDADRRLQEQREDADRRLIDEREAADRRLQLQIRQQHEHQRRAFLVDELLRLGDLYGESIGTSSTGEAQVAIQRLHVHMRAVPGRYASLLKAKMAHNSLDNAAAFEYANRMHAKGINDPKHIDNIMIYEELAENVTEILAQDASLEP